MCDSVDLNLFSAGEAILLDRLPVSLIQSVSLNLFIYR